MKGGANRRSYQSFQISRRTNEAIPSTETLTTSEEIISGTCNPATDYRRGSELSGAQRLAHPVKNTRWQPPGTRAETTQPPAHVHLPPWHDPRRASAVSPHPRPVTAPAIPMRRPHRPTPTPRSDWRANGSAGFGHRAILGVHPIHRPRPIGAPNPSFAASAASVLIQPPGRAAFLIHPVHHLPMNLPPGNGDACMLLVFLGIFHSICHHHDFYVWVGFVSRPLQSCSLSKVRLYFWVFDLR